MLPIVSLAVFGGFLLGMLFFGGLRLTLAGVTRMERPDLLLMTSFMGRLGLVLVGLTAIAGHDIQLHLLAFAGILASRLASIWLWGAAPETGA